MRIVVHAGFHKTGTSSVQAALAAHRAALGPRFLVQTAALSRPLAAVGRAALATSVEPSALPGLRNALALWLGGLRSHQGLLISCEDLVGHMPGRLGRMDYAAAADPGAILRDLGPLLAPARLHEVPLELLAPRRLGPVEALYDLIHLPDALRNALVPVPRVDRNTPLDIADTFVRLNRAGLDPDELDRIKHEMVTLARLLVEGKPPLSSEPPID